MVSPSSCLGKRGIASSSRTTTGRRGSNQVASTAQVTKPTAAAAPKRCRNRRRVNSGGVKFAVYHFLITSYVAIGLGRRFRAEAWRQANIKGGVEQELTGRESEPSKLIYFKVYKSQIPVIEQAIETAALMLGTDKSRGYCLEMICADFLAGAHLDNGNPEILLHSISRYYKFLPGEQQQAFLENLREKAS